MTRYTFLLRFPLAVVERALAIAVETAEASMPADRRRILNTIAGRPKDLFVDERTSLALLDRLGLGMRMW